MTDSHSPQGSLKNLARWLTTGVVLSVIIFGAISLNIVDAFCTPTTDQGNPEQTINEKDSQLRDMEGELLKKLGMGGAAPSPSETQPTSNEARTITLPDVKALVADPTPAPTTTPATAVKALVSTEAPSSELGTEEPAMREPRRSVTVAPSKRIPTRKTASPHSAGDQSERLAISESQITILSQQLEETKEALARSEARVAELSRLVEQQTEGVVDSPDALRTKGSPTLKSDASALAVSFTSSTLPTARIYSSSAALRTTPGKGGTTIYTLNRGSTVRIELRNGSWYRIISSSGTRGWVSGQHLIFYEGSSPNSTVHVRAFDANEEGMGIGY